MATSSFSPVHRPGYPSGASQKRHGSEVLTAGGGGICICVTAVLPNLEGLEAQFSGDICVVRLRGSLGEVSASKIRGLMDRIRATGSSSVLVDASLLGTLSDECAKALVSLGQAVRKMGGTISAYGASGSAASVLSSLSR